MSSSDNVGNGVRASDSVINNNGANNSGAGAGAQNFGQGAGCQNNGPGAGSHNNGPGAGSHNNGPGAGSHNNGPGAGTQNYGSPTQNYGPAAGSQNYGPGAGSHGPGAGSQTYGSGAVSQNYGPGAGCNYRGNVNIGAGAGGRNSGTFSGSNNNLQGLHKHSSENTKAEKSVGRGTESAPIKTENSHGTGVGASGNVINNNEANNSRVGAGGQNFGQGAECQNNGPGAGSHNNGPGAGSHNNGPGAGTQNYGSATQNYGPAAGSQNYGPGAGSHGQGAGSQTYGSGAVSQNYGPDAGCNYGGNVNIGTGAGGRNSGLCSGSINSFNGPDNPSSENKTRKVTDSDHDSNHADGNEEDKMFDGSQNLAKTSKTLLPCKDKMDIEELIPCTQAQKARIKDAIVNLCKAMKHMELTHLADMDENFFYLFWDAIDKTERINIEVGKFRVHFLNLTKVYLGKSEFSIASGDMASNLDEQIEEPAKRVENMNNSFDEIKKLIPELEAKLKLVEEYLVTQPREEGLELQ